MEQQPSSHESANVDRGFIARAKHLGARALRKAVLVVLRPQIERERAADEAMRANEREEAERSRRAQTPPSYYSPTVTAAEQATHAVALPGVTRVEAGPTIQAPDMAKQAVALPGTTEESTPRWAMVGTAAGWREGEHEPRPDLEHVVTYPTALAGREGTPVLPAPATEYPLNLAGRNGQAAESAIPVVDNRYGGWPEGEGHTEPGMLGQGYQPPAPRDPIDPEYR